MNDVVAVGLTTGGVGLAGSILSYFSARGQSRENFAISIQNVHIELTKVRAENLRLRQQHREDERRERRSSYVRFLNAFTHFESFGFLSRATPEDFIAAQSEFKDAQATVMMVGSREVRLGAEELARALSEVVDAAYADEDRAGMEAWRHSYKDSSDALSIALDAVTKAMHEDVIAGMLGDEESP